MSERLDALAAALGETQYDRGSWHLLAQCDHATLADAMRRAGIVADALIVDAPYSERTHAGHDSQEAYDTSGAPRDNKRRQEIGLEPLRRGIDYAAWGRADVDAFVTAWHDRAEWLLSLTDHDLAVEWTASLEAACRYTFAPLACVESGSRARLLGDGPPQWATWLVVSRPRSAAFLDLWHAKRWSHGLKPKGAYVGSCERGRAVVGGKPLWLMRAIVGDYSAPGDLVVDPCAGGGTTLVAAIELGRLAVGCEPDAGRYEIARSRCSKARPQMRLSLDVAAEERTQSALDLTTGAR